jgi:DNA-binding NarL/FixJ family response regulator
VLQPLAPNAQDETVRATTTVLVAVCSPHVREGLVAMFGAVEGFQVVGEASTGEQALELARTFRPHLALIDQDLAGLDAWWTINALQAEQLAQVIIALGWRGNGSLAQVTGAQAWVQLGTAPRELLNSVEAAIRA